MSDTPRVTPSAPPEPGMRAPLSAVDVLAFVCEIFAFVTLAIWGFAPWPFPWNIVVGIAAPVVAILVWALFVSPRAVLAVHPFVARAHRAARLRLRPPSPGGAWGQPWVGLVFGIVAVTAGVFAGRRRFA